MQRNQPPPNYPSLPPKPLNKYKSQETLAVRKNKNVQGTLMGTRILQSQDDDNGRSGSNNGRLRRKKEEKQQPKRLLKFGSTHILRLNSNQKNLESYHSERCLPYLIIDKKQQESVSTQNSKQDSQLENTITACSNKKGVKFSQAIEEQPKRDFQKRKIDKSRSPSILKNSNNILNTSILQEKDYSVANSAASNKKKNKSIEINNQNKGILQKYKNLVAKLSSKVPANRNNRFNQLQYKLKQQIKQKSSQKYKDEIFPPVYSSLFSQKKNQPKKGGDITWMRISQLFKGDKLILANPEKCQLIINRCKESYASQYFIGAFNAVKKSKRLLEKIFENQDYNPSGIYLLKIFQQNVWKYIIIDDYIPVVKGQKGFQPAFLNVKSSTKNTLDIWPFLLQKAYANYYSSYEALLSGNTLDFAQQISGMPSFQIPLTSQNKKKETLTEEEDLQQVDRIIRELKTGEAVAFAMLNQKIPLFPIYYKPQYCYMQKTQESLTFYDPTSNYQPETIKFIDLKTMFKSIYVINLLKYTTCATGVLKNVKKYKVEKGIGSIKEFRSIKYCQIEQPSIRYFRLESPSQCSLTIRQRQKRFYHFNENFSQYIWNRVLLLQKQPYESHGYRWINGQYSNQKSISFSHYLQPGQYFIIIMPQWKPSTSSELTILLYSTTNVEIERKINKIEDKIIEQGCMDLAQRFGQLNQINKVICSYNYISQRLGLIIENIVNQRSDGSGRVTVMRSIKGLKCKVEILPVNRQFYEDQQTKNGVKVHRLIEEVDFQLQKGVNFTVVLKLKGGVDKKFFKSFDFGN